MPALPFPENMHSLQTAQERQVVNELQCILDQSVQQQEHQRTEQHQQNAVSEIQNMMIVKSEQQQPFVSINQQNSINSMSVPLDLQFPSAVVPVTTVESNNNPMVQVQSQMAFGSDQVVSNASQFVPSRSLACMPPPMMSRQNSVEMVNVDQQMLTDLIPNPATMVSIPQSTSNSAITVTCQNLGPMTAVSSNGMCQLGVGGGMVKLESQNSNPMNNQILMGTIVSAVSSNNNQSQPETGVVGVGIGPQNYMGATPGDLHAHPGSIANALTQMSENELINYINPSCFEQNLSLV